MCVKSSIFQWKAWRYNTLVMAHKIYVSTINGMQSFKQIKTGLEYHFSLQDIKAEKFMCIST